MIENILEQLERNEFNDYDELLSFVKGKMSEMKNKFNFKDFVNSLKNLNSDQEVIKCLEEQIQLFQGYGYPPFLISQLQAIVGLKTKDEIVKALEDLISKLEGYGYPPTYGYPSGNPQIQTSETVNLTDIEVFKIGDYGEKGKWTIEDLEKMVKNFYDLKEKLKVPVKIGHWTVGGLEPPAVGWVSDLRLDKEKGILMADFTYVPKVIAEIIKNKGYRNVSCEIYLDEVEGKKPPILRAVSLLGVSQPEVKGLQELKVLYNNEEKRVKTYEIEVEEKPQNDEVEKLKKEIAELKISKFIEDNSEKILPKQKELIKTILLNLETDKKTVKFSEQEMTISDLFKKFIIELPKLSLYEEIVKQENLSEEDEMVKQIEKISQEKGISFVEAWEEYVKDKEIYNLNKEG